MQTLAEPRGSSVCSAQSRPDRPRLHDSLCHSTHRNSWRNPDDGFLGGAICVHFRLGEAGSPPQLISLLLGILTWKVFIFATSGFEASCPSVPQSAENRKSALPGLFCTATTESCIPADERVAGAIQWRFSSRYRQISCRCVWYFDEIWFKVWLLSRM